MNNLGLESLRNGHEKCEIRLVCRWIIYIYSLILLKDFWRNQYSLEWVLAESYGHCTQIQFKKDQKMRSDYGQKRRGWIASFSDILSMVFYLIIFESLSPKLPACNVRTSFTWKRISVNLGWTNVRWTCWLENIVIQWRSNTNPLFFLTVRNNC